MFSKDEIRIANYSNKQARSKGTIINSSIVPKKILEIASKNDLILDFGAGKEAVHTISLRQNGLNVTAYEFGDNVSCLHDVRALEKQYDIVFASNVLNVQINEKMLENTLNQIKDATKSGGIIIFNYPQYPRYINWTTSEMRSFVISVFEKIPELIGGSIYRPMWKIIKD